MEHGEALEAVKASWVKSPLFVDHPLHLVIVSIEDLHASAAHRLSVIVIFGVSFKMAGERLSAKSLTISTAKQVLGYCERGAWGVLGGCFRATQILADSCASSQRWLL